MSLGSQSEGFLYCTRTINDRSVKKSLVSLKNNGLSVYAEDGETQALFIDLNRDTLVKRILPQDEAAMFQIENATSTGSDVNFFRCKTQDESEQWLDAIEQFIEDSATLANLSNDQERALHKAVTALKFPMQFLPPERIVKGKKIGSGGFGTVYAGTCYGVRCAVKVLHKQELNEDERLNLLNEIQACNSVHHPNILLFLGACISGSITLVTELMAGSLDTIFYHPERSNGISLQSRLRMLQQGALGLAWLHTHTPTIVHHDIKPENFLYDANYRVVIADFGLAKLARDGKGWGYFQGTKLWAAPEKLVMMDFNEKCDLYSLALCLWSAVERRMPYKECFGITDAEFIGKVKWDKYRPNCVHPDWTPSLLELVTSLWDDNPASRPSAEEVANRLAVLTHELSLPDPTALDWWATHFPNAECVPVARILNKLDFPDTFNPKMLMMLLVNTASNDHLEVSDIQLGRVLGCFGPWHALTANIHAICSQKWFFGTLSKRKVLSVLHRGCAVGSYLVRLAAPPASFAVHYITSENLVQCLVRRQWDDSNNATYSFVRATQEGEENVKEACPLPSAQAFDSMEALLAVLPVTEPAQGSAFFEYFGNQFYDWGTDEYHE